MLALEACAPDAAPAPFSSPSTAAQAHLTYVELVWLKGRIERWTRFGEVADERILDRRVRFVGFAPDSVFAFVRWAANDFGAIVSRIDILRAVRRGGACSTVPGVTPGGEILLRASGWSRVQRVLTAIDAVEALGVEAADAAPDYWRHLHHRLHGGQPVRPYSLHRHRAWRLRRELDA